MPVSAGKLVAEMFIDVFAVADLDNNDKQPSVLDLINDAVIAAAYAV